VTERDSLKEIGVGAEIFGNQFVFAHPGGET
jgi:hypothetical protein